MNSLGMLTAVPPSSVAEKAGHEIMGAFAVF
jgi:hypothetical protein